MSNSFNDYYEPAVFVFMQRCGDELRGSGRIKTASIYESALRSFRNFRNGEDLDFGSLNFNVVKQYESWLKAKGLVPNTVSFYMRVLRAVYNKAVISGYAEMGNPFRYVYTGVDKTVKRAIDPKLILKLKSFPLSGDLDFSRDMFLLSFYLRGISFVDLAHLSKKNLSGRHIAYYRRKTGQYISIKVEPCISDIIKKYASSVRESDYLLPILVRTPDYYSALRLQNKRLTKISKLMRLSKPITTYVARHSWASMAKHSGIPIRVISEGMGHNSEKTTNIYLDSLDRTIIDKANHKLLKKFNSR